MGSHKILILGTWGASDEQVQFKGQRDWSRLDHADCKSLIHLYGMLSFEVQSG